MDSSDGYITTTDLKAYKAVWRTPIEVDYLNYRMISMPPPSSGGIALGQLLKYAEHALPSHPIHHAESAHVLIEAARRVYADRAHYLGDEDFVDIPDFLLDSQYLQDQWSDFSATTAGISSTLSSDSNLIQKESFETTHTSVVDPSGWAVALTTTLNSNYGSKVMLPQGGFFLNNEMDDFSAKPGVPNQFGLIGSKANAIAPGKRMLSSMTPTIFERDGQLYLVIGSPGGSTIITSIFQVFLHLTHDNAPLREALSKARFHHQWLPDITFIEEINWDHNLGTQLQSMGHKLDTVRKMGLVKAILCDNQIYIGGGDPRTGDHAEGLNE
jgi:gamma-glutamyltranspeptidase/glutathione hydrolase